MSSLYGKAAPAKTKTMTDHLNDFQKALDVAVAEARRSHVDPRRLARVLHDRADAVHLIWAVTSRVV